MSKVKSPVSEPTIPELPFVEFLFGHIQAYMDRPCETEYASGRTQTYRQVVHQCIRVAAYLQKEKIQLEDKVAFYCDNVLEYLPSILGTFYVGGVVTYLRKDNIDNEEYRKIMGMPKFVFASPSQVESLQKAGYKNIIVFGEKEGCVPYRRVMESDVSSFQKPDIKPSTIAAITLTGGTTGLPKGIEYTHRNMVAYVILSMRYRLTLGYAHELGETATVLGNFPCNHGSGLMFRSGVLVFGCHTILTSHLDVMQMCKAIEQHKVTCVQSLPGVLFKILKIPDSERPDISSIKDMNILGGYLTPSIQDDIKKRMNLRGLLHRFVMSECMGTLFEASEVPSSIGKILPGMEVKVVDIKTGEILGPNRKGEMYIRGPCVFGRYHNNPEKTAGAFDKDGFFKTEDIVYYDEEKNFYYVDRLKEMISHKTDFIGGNEIETPLCYHPSVQEAFCIGVPTEDGTEVTRAYVILDKSKPSVTEDDLMQYLKDKIDPFKYPVGGIEFVKDVPRTVLGKAKKVDLLSQYLQSRQKKE